MPTDYPLVRLKRTAEGKRFKGRKPRFPSQIPYDRQAQRLGKVFEDTAGNLDQLSHGVSVAADPRAVIPERCLVFELIGPVFEFNLAAQALGLEWLRTEADGRPPGEEDEDAESEIEENLEGKKLLYLTMPSEAALKKLLAQWKQFKSGEPATSELRPLWKIFGYLAALRVWSFEDRLEPSMAKYVDSILQGDPHREVLVEIDLWYRTEKERRDRSIETLEAMLEEVGGEMLDHVDIEEIHYQGALIRIPAAVAQKLILGKEGIALFDDIMTIRPQSAYMSHIEHDDSIHPKNPITPQVTGQSLAVLLDGYPVERHQALTGRMRVIEIDVTGGQVPVSARYHGTAMASLILNGDLEDNEHPLSQRIIVIPVLTASTDGTREVTPEGKLPIGVIYRALQAIVGADATLDPELAKVVVVNHSICDEYAPFVRRASPWAALLDHYSHVHRLLFVVSAGNIFSSIPLPHQNAAAFQAETPEVQEAYLLAAVEQAKGTRSLLSPAESFNSLTVGAVHQDSAPVVDGAPPDPYPNHRMTNLASALGLGVNRSVKPDLIERGGRFIAQCSNVTGGGVEIHPRSSVHYGQKVAAPSPLGDLGRCIRTAGTSNAAALATRTSHAIAEALDEVFSAEGVDWRDLPTRVPILKALHVHGCAWGRLGELLDRTFPPQDRGQHSQRRATIARFIGFGQSNPSRVISGDGNRITLLGDDQIHSGQMHEYVLPVPASMIGNREVRTVTITLAWTSPITRTTTDQRGVVLKVCGNDGKSNYWDGVNTSGTAQPTSQTAARGTVVHLIRNGKKLMTDANGKLSICVQATAKTGFETEDVPYAIAISLELAQQQRSQLYQEVSQAIRIRPRARV